ncbi:MAG: hypothetical protein IJC05_05125 [Phascolarctobacterium sp.]|nr:hypothetical protein [Phascolarctobacterium sp.]
MKKQDRKDAVDMKLMDAIKCCIDHCVSVSAYSMSRSTVWMPKDIFLTAFKNFSKEFLENANGYNYYKLTAVFDGAEYSTIIGEKEGAQLETI